MTLEKFDIVLVDFPFSNLTKTKKRPALVINSLEGENFILCQITTKRRGIQKYEILLPKDACVGDIRFDSFIYVDMIFTLHRSLIYKKIGVIGDLKIKEIINRKLKLII
ncbi:type II toxin-antitoxin system PemK/MazF family toxin [Candidatus Pacearchaeota archaeon]|nr:type II toxin-antitoxin system PemK/MazF family toxin [Candidatus Pacearchaeota archaeon]